MDNWYADADEMLHYDWRKNVFDHIRLKTHEKRARKQQLEASEKKEKETQKRLVC